MNDDSGLVRITKRKKTRNCRDVISYQTRRPGVIFLQTKLNNIHFSNRDSDFYETIEYEINAQDHLNRYVRIIDLQNHLKDTWIERLIDASDFKKEVWIKGKFSAGNTGVERNIGHIRVMLDDKPICPKWKGRK